MKMGVEVSQSIFYPFSFLIAKFNFKRTIYFHSDF